MGRTYTNIKEDGCTLIEVEEKKAKAKVSKISVWLMETGGQREYNCVCMNKFIYDKSAIGVLINPDIVFTLTFQRWSNTTFSSYLALLV